MTITYKVKNGLYLNITNRCPCDCIFCLRHNGESVYGSDPLWLEREPTVEEICQSIDAKDLSEFSEIVFCGYGEPTERLEDLIKVAKHIKEKSNIKIRINTNGLADLINGKETAPMLENLIDTVSISLNAANKEDYFNVVRPKFGMKSFDQMLKYAKDCTKYVPNVVMTVVDLVTSKEDQQKCEEICKSVGAKLRVRPCE
ncbi:MAG: TIGR04100 family radical SAM protein [Clostridia bacterium]|nr:TIGR04100 family radical SAM protein [Clostridia bacterium]